MASLGIIFCKDKEKKDVMQKFLPQKTNNNAEDVANDIFHQFLATCGDEKDNVLKPQRQRVETAKTTC
ncbi:MAG: hypothetical protein J5661_04075 [Bacteroidaceae bacterium]|nr:hypothetical protein [Bacteroidaceae bacterium]